MQILQICAVCSFYFYFISFIVTIKTTNSLSFKATLKTTDVKQHSRMVDQTPKRELSLTDANKNGSYDCSASNTMIKCLSCWLVALTESRINRKLTLDCGDNKASASRPTSSNSLSKSRTKFGVDAEVGVEAVVASLVAAAFDAVDEVLDGCET